MPPSTSLLSSAEKRLDLLERAESMNVLVMSGIPFETGEDLNVLIPDVCKAIKYTRSLDSITSAYRRGSKLNFTTDSKSASSIYLTFHNFDCKQHFFSLYLKSSLNLAHVGFAAKKRIFVNEQLTPKNYNIFKFAKQLKNDKAIHNYYTYRGLVFVKLTSSETAKAVCVCSKDDLSSLIHRAAEHDAVNN